MGQVLLSRPVRRALPALLLAATQAPCGATEDTDTPGAGKWEINVVVSGEHTASSRSYAVPASDVNYGWGERTQLVAAVPRVLLREPGVAPRSGIGSATLGVKWRFYEDAPAGVALALFPTYGWNLSSRAARDGLTDPGRTVGLPLLAGIRRGDTALFAEAGRNVAQYGPREWVAGLKLTHQCLPALECRTELDYSHPDGERARSLASIGFKWRLADSLIVQGSVGRDLGPVRDDGRRLAFTLGVQLLR